MINLFISIIAIVYAIFAIQRLERKIKKMSAAVDRIVKAAGEIQSDAATITTVVTDLRALVKSLRDQLSSGGGLDDTALNAAADQLEQADKQLDSLGSTAEVPAEPPV